MRIHAFSLIWVLVIWIGGCISPPQQEAHTVDFPAIPSGSPSLIVLGVAQDGGAPHAGCMRDCCKNRWQHPEEANRVVSLGVIDPVSRQTFLLEATPDLSAQMQELQQIAGLSSQKAPNGIFLTHAHIGHYTGLMYLGREVLGAAKVPVYTMPRMKTFLERNGPWSQLVSLQNIELQPLKKDSSVHLSRQLAITPLKVPHRDEFSETVGFLIEGPEKRVLFIPDIDKWEKWNRNIDSLVSKVDIAYLDGTFYENGEIPGRDMSLIPHPFVEESLDRFNHLPDSLKSRIRFIHFNHTNPLLVTNGEEANQVQKQGFGLARRYEVVSL